MFSINVTNQSSGTLTTSTGEQIAPNTGWGTGSPPEPLWIDGPMGRVGILDIGDAHIPGDSSETWGVLIGYQEMSVVGRYEGGGLLSMTVDAYFQFSLTGMNFRQVQLEGLIIDPAAVTTAAASA